MAETYLALLDNARMQSKDAFDRIDDAMMKNIQLRNQASQFAVESTMKAAEFEQNQRMDQARVQDMQINNQLQADKFAFDKDMTLKQFEIEKDIAPLRKQSAVLALESQKQRYKLDLDNLANKEFNDITSVYDESIGYDLARTMNTDMARDYLGVKSKWKAKVANGEVFDNASYEKEVGELRFKYKDAPISDSKEYSDEHQLLMGNISPALGTAYGRRHPHTQATRAALGSTFYDLPDNQVGKYVQDYSGMFAQEEIGALWAGRQTYQRNSQIIKENYEQADRLANELTSINQKQYPEQWRQKTERMTMLYSEAKKAQDQNTKFHMDASLEKFGIQPAEIPRTSAELEKEIPTTFNEDLAKEGKPTLGFNSYGPDDEQGRGIKRRLDDVVNIFTEGSEGGIGRTIIKGINVSWFNDTRVDEIDDATKVRIKTQVVDNIDKLSDEDDLYMSKAFTRKNINALLGKVKGDTNIPISDDVKKILFESFSVRPEGLTGTDSAGLKFSELQNQSDKGFLQKLMGGNTFDNPEEIFDLVGKIKSIPLREEVKKEILGALTTAAFSSALKTK